MTIFIKKLYNTSSKKSYQRDRVEVLIQEKLTNKKLYQQVFSDMSLNPSTQKFCLLP
ncbi:MAG: hypothetical protein ACFB02_12835 [Mastigocoleus sp.]